MTAPQRPEPHRETVEMVDGRIYYSDDNWQTIYRKHRRDMLRIFPVLDKDEADFARFIAVSQTSWQGNAS